MLEDTDLVGQTQKLRHTLRSFCLAGQKKKNLNWKFMNTKHYSDGLLRGRDSEY